ncbi:hypothetical protein K469DRAFT_559942 [Zopfia rhizophila CBS 207.26]|uniref:HCP-like protein n=1 Tax=Zopfia rhizophila CBS 207.26 TaxID=1314779 RepID=A0A6A6EIL3_9PEZI|nr:hypothetical protein K469DRAFT_559942 [Zopfia rhizophila CBS 207.26]
MAYEQYNNYQQPRQQQYYNQGTPQQVQQPAGYNDQYDDYGYDQGQYEQWDDGYYNQQQGGGWGNGQQYQGGYNDMNGQVRRPPQGRRPPPRDQYGQEPMYSEQMYQDQPRGQDPRGRPMGPNGGPVQGGMQRGDSRGRGGRPPNLQQRQPALKPPVRERALVSPVSPANLPQDNPFPTFPSQKAKPRPKAGSMDEAMALMSIGHEKDGQGRPSGPPQGRGRGQGPPLQNPAPPAGRGYGHPDMQRQDSGHFEGNGRRQQPPPNQGYGQQRPPPINLEGARTRPQRPYDQVSPMQQSFGPNTQRSMTLPQNMSGASNERGYDTQQQWAEPGPVAGYHGPDSPTYIPPRPATASGTKQSGFGRLQQFDQRPPPMPQAQQHHQQQPQDDGRGDLDNLYDDYYGDSNLQDRRSKSSSIDMPNFDAIPESDSRHRRGFSIEDHLSPTSTATTTQSMALATAGPADAAAAQKENFYQQATRSRSQPDLHGQYGQGNGGVYEMAGDAPGMPPLPRSNSNHNAPNGLPNGPRGRGPPPRGMTMDSGPGRGPPPGQGYGLGQSQNFDPRYGRQQPPMHRGYSDESAYSEPAMSNASPIVPGNPIQRPGTAAPISGRMQSDPIQRRPGTTQPQRMNPDALPSHPTPVRAGLMQQQDQTPSPQPARPPPVRQYNTDPTPVGYGTQQTSSVPAQRRASVPHPVTHDELNRLRNTWKFNPSDHANGLQLAKKLVEAASVLADEGGTADTRTRNKNREKFIFEAHKIVKKLVASGSQDAMFYLADCYGQGLLGLQVDTKEAFTLYQSAAKAGHAASAYRTAVCCEMGHEEGGGTKKDPLKAVQWYRRAAALGDTPAMYKVGMILLKGLLGQQKNLGEAINMLKRAADRADEQNPHALHELALLYEAQTGNERIIRDEAYAYSLFKQAAELGYKFSQFRLGQAYEYGLLGCQIDARSSLAWYTRAATQEEHQSELALSGWYLTGSQGILEQSDTEAYLWARKAACAEPPLPKALFAMGYFTEVGIGCPRSLEEAKRWYGRAAAYKFPKAQERLEELKRGGAKVQKGRERLSRSNQKQHEENCVVM